MCGLRNLSSAKDAKLDGTGALLDLGREEAAPEAVCEGSHCSEATIDFVCLIGATGWGKAYSRQDL